jgi:hypothetical protein
VLHDVMHANRLSTAISTAVTLPRAPCIVTGRFTLAQQRSNPKRDFEEQFA